MLLITFSSPYCRPDFDDDDDGNKLFRYIFLILFLNKAMWGDIFSVRIVRAAEITSSVFSVFSLGVTMKQQAPTMIKNALPGRRMN